MVDVVTSTVAAYTADAETQTRSTGYNVQASNWNQIINDLRSLNDSLNGSQAVPAWDVTGTLDVGGNATFSATDCNFQIGDGAGSPNIYFTKADAGNFNIGFTEGGTSSTNRRWILQFATDEDLVFLRRNGSGGSVDTPLRMDWTGGNLIVGNDIEMGSGGPVLTVGSGSPESAVTADVGSIFMRTDGGASTSMYVKESGTGNTGWVAK